MGQETPERELHHYGVIKMKGDNRLEYIVERPPLGEAPSNLVSYGRYLLTFKIFEKLEELLCNHQTGEFMLVDALTLLAKSSDVLVEKTKGKWLTTGDPLNHLKAQLYLASTTKEFKTSLLEFIKREIDTY